MADNAFERTQVHSDSGAVPPTPLYAPPVAEADCSDRAGGSLRHPGRARSRLPRRDLRQEPASPGTWRVGPI